MTRSGPDLSDNTFDYIVVGGGSAGCLLANRLSRDPSTRVLLLEAGRKDDYPWIHIPVGYLYCIGNPRTDWLFKTEPDAGLNGRSLRYPRGKTLGGSTCTTVAPRSPRIIATAGPAMYWPKSSTRTPERGKVLREIDVILNAPPKRSVPSGPSGVFDDPAGRYGTIPPMPSSIATS